MNMTNRPHYSLIQKGVRVRQTVIKPNQDMLSPIKPTPINEYMKTDSRNLNEQYEAKKSARGKTKSGNKLNS